MTRLLKNKVALVTGGSSGIGRASAIAFAREGAKVIVADVATEGGEETIKMIKDTGGEATFIKADVSNMMDVEPLLMKTIEIYGQLDCAHNNAGVVGDTASTADCTKENWDRIISINLNGIWFCMKYEIPQMLKNGGGVIINTSSLAGLHGIRNRPAYAASKHGVIGLTKSAALEYAKEGIRINAVCPGFTRTPLNIGKEDTGQDAHFLGEYVAGRPATPEEISEPVVWLCSDSASFINGHALIVDGGRMAL